MNTIANGVFDNDNRRALATDASASPAAKSSTAPTLSAPGGLSTLGKLDWTKQDEQATAALIEQRIGIPGTKVTFAVMDVPGEVEREEGYWSVKRGEQELIQILRVQNGAPEGPGPATVIVWTTDVATVDGIKVGDTIATVLAKHPDLTCRFRDGDDGGMIESTVPAAIQCRSMSGGELVYIPNAQKAKKLKQGDVKPTALAKLEIVAIAHEFYGWR